jgi:hypothetical protein
MPDFFVSKTEAKEKEAVIAERALLKKLCGKELTDQEAFEAEQDLLSAFAWLVEMDEKYGKKTP